LGEICRDRGKILKCLLKKCKDENVNWVHLAQDRVLYWVVANMVMNLQVP
jgi:hypothetical protein